MGIDDVEVPAVDSLETFGAYVQSKGPRTDVTLHLLREGKPTDIVVNLMRRPPDLETRTFLWGGGGYVPPPQDEVEEKEFREWLKLQREQDRKTE